MPDRVDRVGVFDLRKAQTTAPAEPPAPVRSALPARDALPDSPAGTGKAFESPAQANSGPQGLSEESWYE